MARSFTEDGAVGAADSPVAGSSQSTTALTGANTGTDGSVAGANTSPQAVGNTANMLAYAPGAVGGAVTGGGDNSYSNGFTQALPSDTTSVGGKANLAFLAAHPEFGYSVNPQYFSDGGPVEKDSDSDSGSATGLSDDSSGGSSFDPSEALKAVNDTLAYGRQLHGLGGSGNDNQQVASGFNPSQSDTGAPRPQPGPGGLAPAANPFGKRAVPPGSYQSGDASSGSGLTQVASGFNPSQSETGIPRPQPGPGGLPPTANPFGKRVVPPGSYQTMG